MRLLLLMLFITTMLFGSNEIFVLPEMASKAENRIVKEINNSSKSIQVMIYTFTNWRIRDALVNAKKRGVDVKIVIDKNEYNQDTINYLRQNKIPVCIHNGEGIMHLKILTIDNKLSIEGTANYTKSAFSKNVEKVFVLDSSINIKINNQLFKELNTSCK